MRAAYDLRRTLEIRPVTIAQLRRDKVGMNHLVRHNTHQIVRRADILSRDPDAMIYRAWNLVVVSVAIGVSRDMELNLVRVRELPTFERARRAQVLIRRGSHLGGYRKTHFASNP